MNKVTTTDLSDFGYREITMTRDLLSAWLDKGLPDDFEENEVTVMLNMNSGNVFLTNSEFQVAMMNGDALESWYYCGNCGHEGFADDCKLNDEGCNECNPILEEG